MQGEIDESTIIVGNFHTPLWEIDIPRRQKINKDFVELNSTINLLDLIDIHRILFPVNVLLSSHGTFTKIDHGHSGSQNTSH